jgi:hypothetical protein
VPSQTIDALLRNQVYIGRFEVPGYGISTRGDFEPLVSEKVFYRVQAILDGRGNIGNKRPTRRCSRRSALDRRLSRDDHHARLAAERRPVRRH